MCIFLLFVQTPKLSNEQLVLYDHLWDYPQQEHSLFPRFLQYVSLGPIQKNLWYVCFFVLMKTKHRKKMWLFSNTTWSSDFYNYRPSVNFAYLMSFCFNLSPKSTASLTFGSAWKSSNSGILSPISTEKKIEHDNKVIVSFM